MKSLDRLANAGEKFLVSKTVETYVNLAVMGTLTVVVLAQTAKLFHLLRGFAAGLGM